MCILKIKYWGILLLTLCHFYVVWSQKNVYNNPILPGFYPDPSICRVGEDYYLVNSSFEYFPGVPIFKSKDLVHWKQIGNVLNRPSQLALDSVKYGVSGAFAPTIRFHNNMFYMTTTMCGSKNPERGGNFIVTSNTPEGPWSDPYFLKDAPGIDPFIFFDEDGKAYFIGTRFAEGEEKKYWKHSIIWMKELDLKNMQLVGEEIKLLSQGGALHNARNAEGPRLFKRNGYYYLLIAEGGTGFEHAVTVFRSKNIRGPYENNPANPILTNRHLGTSSPIQSIGHADLVETQTGEWWMVVLGTRPYGGNHINLARETFLVPMKWENDWPVGAPGKGYVTMQNECPKLPEYCFETNNSINHFEDEQMSFEWNYIRLPELENYKLNERKGFLRLYLSDVTINQEKNPTFIGRRQQHKDILVETKMEFNPDRDGECAGLVVFQSPKCNYKFIKVYNRDKEYIELIKCDNGVEITQGKMGITNPIVYMRIITEGQDYYFYYSTNNIEWFQIGDKQDGRILNSYYSGGFTGLYIGMYASSNGRKTTQYADFDYFKYTENFN